MAAVFNGTIGGHSVSIRACLADSVTPRPARFFLVGKCQTGKTLVLFAPKVGLRKGCGVPIIHHGRISVLPHGPSQVPAPPAKGDFFALWIFETIAAETAGPRVARWSLGDWRVLPVPGDPVWVDRRKTAS